MRLGPAPASDVGDNIYDVLRLRSMLATSPHGHMTSFGLGQVHRESCDYCGHMFERPDLEVVGMGLGFMCAGCRALINRACASGLLNFWQSCDMALLAKVHAPSGTPVAAGVCLAPFADLRPMTQRPWWRERKFWDRGDHGRRIWRFFQNMVWPTESSCNSGSRDDER